MWRWQFHFAEKTEEEDEARGRGGEKERYTGTQQPSVIISPEEKLPILNMSPVEQTEGVTSCIHIYLSSP